MTTITQYATDTTGKPAPTPDGKNLFLRIEVRNDKAIINCRDVEHAGKHRNRKVVFHADKSCNLHFSNPNVFTPQPQVPEKLTAGTETPFFIDDSVGTNRETMTVCSVSIQGTEPATLHDSPPRIVVP